MTGDSWKRDPGVAMLLRAGSLTRNLVIHNTRLPPIFHKYIILKEVKAFVLIDFCKSIIPKDLYRTRIERKGLALVNRISNRTTVSEADGGSKSSIPYS